MGRYRLSRKADQDIQSIFEFGAERFGIAQAENYVLGLHEQLALLADEPDSRPDIKILNTYFSTLRPRIALDLLPKIRFRDRDRAHPWAAGFEQGLPRIRTQRLKSAICQDLQEVGTAL